MENSGTGLQERAGRVYEFGPFRLDAEKRLLLRGGEPVRRRDAKGGVLTRKVVETLLALVERRGVVVSTDDLMKSVWPDTVVEESNLASNISILRKALGKMEDGRDYIETFPTRGYGFNAPVREARADAALSAGDEPGRDEQAGDVVGVSELIIRRRTRTHILEEEEETGEGGAEEADAAGSSAFVAGRQEAPRLVSGDGGPTVETSLERQVSGAVAPADARRWRRRKVLAVSALAAVALAAGLLVAWKLYGGRGGTGAGEPYARTRLVRVTNNGRAAFAAVSPDAQFVAHVQGGAGSQSLWLRHLATGSDKEIVPADKQSYSALIFSRDGHHVYFIKFFNEWGGVLFRVPVLGGTPQELARDVDGTASFSPDGRSFAFVRGLPHKKQEHLLVADADGRNERVLSTHEPQTIFVTSSLNGWGPAWSPDGESIAHMYRLKDEGGDFYRAVALTRVADGSLRQLTFHKWRTVGAIAWLPDASGLIVCASDGEAGTPRQLWHVNARDGAARRITNDLHTYDGVSLSADGATLVAVQSERRASIWVAPEGDAGRAAELESEGRGDGATGLAWTDEGRIVYTSTSGGETDIWSMNADGTGRKRLTFDNQVGNNVRVSAGGPYVFYTLLRKGEITIWRMDADGGGARQVTPGPDDLNPSATSDGSWVYFMSTRSGRSTLWKAPAGGGDPVQLVDYASTRPVVSPDGRLIAFNHIDESAMRYRNAVVSAEGGPPLKQFDLPQAVFQILRWTPDSAALTYLDTRGGTTNIWRQPLDGGQSTQLTNFTSQRIFNYAWSPDGRQLALSRGVVNSDVVTLTALPPE